RRLLPGHGCTVTTAQLTAEPRSAPPATSVGKCLAATTRSTPTTVAAAYRITAVRVERGRFRPWASTGDVGGEMPAMGDYGVGRGRGERQLRVSRRERLTVIPDVRGRGSRRGVQNG